MSSIYFMKTNIRFISRIGIWTIMLLGAFQQLVAQRITYSEPEREDSRRTNFDIIGKVGGHILVFKNNRNSNDVCVYDTDMKLLERVKQTDMNDRWINVDFIAYPDFAWMIYQVQRKNIVYCMAAKINADGKRMTDPIELDTTRIGWAADNKIYTSIYSDDKQRIMVFKVNSKNPKNFLFTTLLFNVDLQLQAKHQMTLPMEERNDYFTDFLLDNEGDLVFGKFRRRNGSDYVLDVSLIMKKANEEFFRTKEVEMQDHVLDEVKLKVDNTNRRYLFNAFYYKQKRGNIEGLYLAIWDKKSDSLITSIEMPFNDELRKMAKGPDANLRLAFNDYFISDVITKRDGGFLLVAESMYTSSRGSAFNRWNYMNYNSPWMSPLDYYYWSPYSYYGPWSSPFYRWGGGQNVRYHAENMMIISMDSSGHPDWTNVIPKSQFDDETDASISHFTMITGGELHFLFNLYERRTLLLNDQSIGPDGKVTRYPTLKNLNREIEFLPRYGKQISAYEALIPCFYRNYLTFAKVEF